MDFFPCILSLKMCEACVQFIKTLVMIQNVMQLSVFYKQMGKKEKSAFRCSELVCASACRYFDCLLPK
jgi:hypothetical protein